MRSRTARLGPRPLIAALLLLLPLADCAARPFGLATPVGPRAADYFEDFDILGISESQLWRHTSRPPEGAGTATVRVPPGTEFVIPILEGWELSYGRTEAESTERHFGFSAITILPRRWELAPSPSSSTDVEIGMTGLITDSGGSTDYQAQVRFSALFLRRASGAFVPVDPAAVAPLGLVHQEHVFVKESDIADGRSVLRRVLTHRVPPVATRVVPALVGFVLGYGAGHTPLSPHIGRPERPDGRQLKRARAMAQFAAGTPVAAAGSAEMILRDADGAEPWFGAMDVNVLGFAPMSAIEGTTLPFGTVAGFLNRSVSLRGNEGANVATEIVTVDVPADTVDFFPLLLSWSASRGELIQDPDTSTILWRRQDRPFGVAQVGAFPVSLRPGPVPGVKSASFMVSARLRDNELPGDWHATVGLTVLCIRHGRP